MEKAKELNPNEMELLQHMGKTPQLTNHELARLLNLKTSSYVSTLKAGLEERGYFVGPYYQTDYGKIFCNRLRKAVAIILFEQPYEFMLSLLKNVDCFSYLYPIEERFFKSYMAGIFDSDTEAVRRIFSYLKEEGVIFHYELYLQERQTYVICPTFLSDSREATKDPPLDNLLDEVAVPDLSFSEGEVLPLALPEKVLISSFELGVSSLTTVMEKERARGNFFTYAEWKVAKKWLQSRKIIKPVYDIFPFPAGDCVHVFLFVRGKTPDITERVLFNFGKDSRIFKKLFLWTSYDTKKTYGVIYCICHPEFTIRLLAQLDRYEEIEDKKSFVIRKKFSLWEGKGITMDRYDPSSRTLHYPYAEYFEKVKAFVEANPW